MFPRGHRQAAGLVGLAVVLCCAPAAAEEAADGWSVGGRADAALEAHAGPWFPTLERSSSLRLGRDHGAAADGARLRDDLGAPRRYTAGAVEVFVPLGVAGTLGGDLLLLDADHQAGIFDREVELDGVLFQPGDVVRSDLRMIWTRLIHAYDLRYTVELRPEVPLTFFAGPLLVFGDWDIQVRTREVAPGGGGRRAREHINAWVLSVGARFGVEVAEVVRFGADLEVLPGAELSLSSTEIVEWQRARFYAGLTLGAFDVTVGYRFLHTVAAARDEEIDVTLRGVDVLLGVSF